MLQNWQWVYVPLYMVTTNTNGFLVSGNSIYETMRSLFYLLAVIVTFFVSVLLYPVIMIGYILLIGYCLTKGQ